MKHLSITMNHLRTFVVVARTGSFNQAAEELSRTQPAVTLAIKQLEKYLGLKLFERTTRRVAPTSEGGNFLPIAERLVRDFDMAIDDLTASVECRTGHVSVAVLPSVATSLLPSLIGEFTSRYPNISVHLNDNTAQGVQHSVERNEVDFGIGSVWHPNNKLEFQPLLEDSFELVCHRDHPLARQESADWRQFEGTSFLGTGLTHALKMQKYIGSPKFEFSTTTTLFAMLRANLGVTALPALAVPRDNELVSIPLLNPVEKRTIGVIKRHQWTLSPAANAMLDLLTVTLPALLERLNLKSVTELSAQR